MLQQYRGAQIVALRSEHKKVISNTSLLLQLLKRGIIKLGHTLHNAKVKKGFQWDLESEYARGAIQYSCRSL